MKKIRLLEFDIMRCIAFLFIVMQHTFGGYSNRANISWTNFLISKFIYQLSDLGTPIFIFLTGIGLYYSHKEHLDIKDFYIKKLKFLVLPYVVISMIIILINHDPINSDLIWILLSGGAQYHLWYMGLILRIYLYFPLFYYFMKFINKQNKYIRALCFPVVFYIVNFVINPYRIIEDIKYFLFKTPGEFQLKFANVSPLCYITYFIVGIYIINHFETFKKVIFKIKYLIFALYGFFFAQTFYLMLCKHFETEPYYIVSNSIREAFYKPLGILCIYIAAYYINSKFDVVSKVMIFISKYSYTAYMIHILVLNSLACYLSITNELISTAKLWFCAVIVSIAISYLLSLLPCAKYLFGCKTKLNTIDIQNFKKAFSR